MDRHDMDEHRRQMHEHLAHVQALRARLPPRDAEGNAGPPTITLPVPLPMATAWNALPPEKRTAYAQTIVAAWLDPLTRLPTEEPVLHPPCPRAHAYLPCCRSLMARACARGGQTRRHIAVRSRP
jgi:hypothetical protein